MVDGNNHSAAKCCTKSMINLYYSIMTAIQKSLKRVRISIIKTGCKVPTYPQINKLNYKQLKL